MENFFVGSVPFGLPHLLVIALFVIVTVLLVLFTKLFVKKNYYIVVIKIVAGLTLLATIISRFIYNNWAPTLLDFLPNTYCSTMGFVLPILVLVCKKDSKILIFALFAGFMGGMLTLLSGEDIGQVEVIRTFISYLYHSLMITLSILCVALGHGEPTLDKTPAVFNGLAIMMVYGLFSNQVFGYSNNMYINADILPGLTWWMVGLIMMGIYVVMALVYEAVTLPWKDQHLSILFRKRNRPITNK